MAVTVRRPFHLARTLGNISVKNQSKWCEISHSSRRLSSTDSRDPQVISDAFLAKFANGKPFVATQLLDTNQMRLFSLTLDRPYLHNAAAGPSLEHDAPKEGTPIPPFYHYPYFTPAQLPGILGTDGTDASFNPEAPFTRRMWAGGTVVWSGAPKQNYLRVGDTVTETTKVLSCEPKTIKKTGESMLVVGIVKEFHDSKGNLCVEDYRNWVFREALDLSKPSKPPVKPPLKSETELNSMGEGKHVRTFNRDTVQLFRMSALTFNGHRIHYDKPWAVDVEGHRNVVIHGPLNFISMLDLWRDVNSPNDESAQYVYPKSVTYRAKSPVYAGEGYRILVDKQAQDHRGEKKIEMQAVSDDGTPCMQGHIIPA